MQEWLGAYQGLLGWLGGASLLMFVASLVLLPLLVARLPSDYFHPTRDGHLWLARFSPPTRALLLLAGNLLGATLIVCGVLMLVLPGQGILTILIGLSLTSFPGKRDLERRLIGYPAVLSALNWLRLKAKRPPLRV